MNDKIRILDPENDECGNIEYKLKFHCKVGKDRMTKLITQAMWRMDEGYKMTGLREAIYYIGINDNGTLGGLDLNDLINSIKKFKSSVKGANAKIISSQFLCLKGGNYAKIKIQQLPKKSKFEDIMIGFLGPNGSGKTSLIGHLSYGIDDDGNGNARKCVFRHDHESDDGITSSIKYDLIGFSKEKINNYTMGFIGSWEDIVEGSSKVISLTDMPGHFKYYKTTFFCLSSHLHDYICLMIKIDCSINDLNTLFFHMFVCNMLEIPYFLVISKMDKYDKFTDNEKIEKIKILKNKIENFCKINFHYKFKKIEIIYNTKELTKLQVLKMMSENIKLMIPISVVTRENIKSLHKVLNFLPTINFKQNNNNFDDSIFMLYDTIYLPDIGIAAIGRVLEGSIKIGNELLIGPIDNSFSNVTVKSIHKKQITSQKICKNSHGSLVLKFNDKKLETKITKQLMLITPNNINKFVNKFFILLNNKIIKQNKKKGYTFHNLNANKIEKKNYIMIYSNNIYENIIVMNIIKTEKKVILHVKFKKEKIKYISDGSSIIINFPQVFLFGKTFKKLNKIINKD